VIFTSRAAARAAACVALTACATNPATNAAATGALLRVEARSGTYQYDADVETGRTVTTDDSGGSSEAVHYERQTLTANYLDWKLYEGDQEIDEQDYFRLAGDDSAFKEVKRDRTFKEQVQRWGAVGAIAGTAAAIAIYALAPTTDDGFGHTDMSPGWRNAAIYSFTAGELGVAAWLWGALSMPGHGSSKHHMDLDRTSQDAEVVCFNGHCSENRDAPRRRAASSRR
jgi:hypothetical protein